MEAKPVLVAGATGYVGGRLVSQLLESGYRVRAMGRSLAKVSCRPWRKRSKLECVQADIMDLESLREAVRGCGVVYYLVHSMDRMASDFVEADRVGAKNMAQAAAQAGVEKIIYLGGLGDRSDKSLSSHLRSRNEVADILRAGSVPVTILRAAVILGSGSASFEMLRYLVDRLPLMVTPLWVFTPSQPISIKNVLNYLQGCLENDKTTDQTFDIGGPEIVTYKRLMQIYAEEAGLHRRLIVPIPFFSRKLSGFWIHLITPIPSSIAIPLTEGLRNRAVCKDNRIRELIPQQLFSCRETIKRAMERIKQEKVETCWSDAGDPLPPEWTYCGDAEYSGGTIMECGYRAILNASSAEVWDAVSAIGGRTGWYFGNILWRIRGYMDLFAGGVGLRRGRRDRKKLYVGDALDFWRVVEIKEHRRLLLLAEMKTPGEALLDFRLNPAGENRTELQMLSRFLPRGLSGILYWYVLYPPHRWIFDGTIRAIAKGIGKPIVKGPEFFTSKIQDVCYLPPPEDRGAD